MSKTKLVLIMYLFLILETFSCRSINEFYVYLVENVDEVKITFEFANFKENRTIKKSLIINQKDDIVNICKIISSVEFGRPAP